MDNNDKIRLKDLSRNPYRDYVDNRNFFQKAVYSINKVLYVYSLIWETNKWIMLAFAGIVLFTGLQPVASVWLGKKVIGILAESMSGGFREEAARLLILYSCLYFGLTLATRLANTFNSALSRLMGDVLARNIKIKIMKKAGEIDMACFDDAEFYSKMENANNEAGNRPISIMNSSYQLISSIISIISFVTVVATYNRLFAALLLISSIPVGYISMYIRGRNYRLHVRQSVERRKMSYYSSLVTNRYTVMEVKLYDMCDLLIEKYKEAFESAYKQTKALQKLIIKWTCFGSLCSLVTLAWVYIDMGISTLKGIISLENFSFFTGAATNIERSVVNITSTVSGIYEGSLFIDNLKEFLEQEITIKPAVEPPKRVKINQKHRIEFQNVSFSYPGTDKKVLDDLSFVIEEGQTVALVGHNGAGKTTLLKLLLRLYDPTEGKILLDGTDIREYDPYDLYKLYSVVFQDFGKLAFSIRENIALGNLDNINDLLAIKNAAKSSNADEFIEKLENGYDTELTRQFDRNGLELSVGQWQKIAVARAFFRNGEILIFDEPSASMDAEAEYNLFKQLEEMKEEKTAIFVSHRLSSATISQKVLFLENGKLVEMGTHEQLMENGGPYSRLFTMQAKRYIADKQKTEDREIL
ncbi:MAG: ABC transporter ATP-binding protein [Clostridiaceae bacterium]|nr:ABC transporter ATP-binding protein [Clostridiaceae bacterium]